MQEYSQLINLDSLNCKMFKHNDSVTLLLRFHHNLFKFQHAQYVQGIGENIGKRTRADKPAVYASGLEGREFFFKLPQIDMSSIGTKPIDAPHSTPAATFADSRRLEGKRERSWEENMKDEFCFGSSLEHSRMPGRTDGRIGRGDTTSEATVPSSKVGFLFLYTCQCSSDTQSQFCLVYHCSDPTYY